MIRVLIAEDMKELAKHFATVLKKDPNIEVVGCVCRGDEAVKECEKLRPDVILMDIEMETKTAGLYATQEILKQWPETKIIILTVYEEDELVFQAYQRSGLHFKKFCFGRRRNVYSGGFRGTFTYSSGDCEENPKRISTHSQFGKQFFILFEYSNAVDPERNGCVRSHQSGVYQNPNL